MMHMCFREAVHSHVSGRERERGRWSVGSCVSLSPASCEDAKKETILVVRKSCIQERMSHSHFACVCKYSTLVISCTYSVPYISLSQLLDVSACEVAFVSIQHAAAIDETREYKIPKQNLCYDSRDKGQR